MANRISSNAGQFAWFFQRISGLVLVIMLYAHYQVNHFSPQGELSTFAQVAPILASPFWKTFNVVFIGLSLYHGLNGVWIIAADYLHKEWQRLTVYGLLWTVGIVVMVIGLIVIVPFQPGIIPQ